MNCIYSVLLKKNISYKKIEPLIVSGDGYYAYTCFDAIKDPKHPETVFEADLVVSKRNGGGLGAGQVTPDINPNYRMDDGAFTSYVMGGSNLQTSDTAAQSYRDANGDGRMDIAHFEYITTAGDDDIVFGVTITPLQ